MSLPVRHLYEFGEFRLDTEEKILMRGDSPVELTPKTFELLTFFVENPGRLLKKDEIMEKIWAESFVEDSNLTFNIGQLRKLLGDDAQQPIFIKTVRQHGYRFIAPVNEIVAEPHPETVEDLTPKVVEDISKTVSETTSASFSEHISRPNFAFVGLVVLLIAGLAGALILYGYFGNKSPNAPILYAPFASEKLSTNGKVVHAVLSPDGKNVVYTVGKGSEKEGVWIRQIESGNNVEIIPASDDLYGGLAISPDGQTLYFARTPRNSGEPFSIYRVSIFGGIPNKIVSNTEGWISISPDGTKISFVRRPRTDEENASLWIADTADGKNERKLVVRPRPFRIADSEFSPDGKRIAFAAGQSENSGNEFGLSEVDLETGNERQLTKEKFFVISNLTHLPGNSGWLVTASRTPNINLRIWQISAATGEATPLTKDSETYGVLSLDKEATKLVSTQIKQDFHLRLINLENPAENRILSDANSLSFAPDGKLYFSSVMSGDTEIWSINPNGSNQRQLTNNKSDVGTPIVSPDNNSVYFSSNRTGTAQIWRMNPDGSNQTQITQKEGGYALFISPDGEWLYYHHGINRTLWRVSTKTGEEQIVLNKSKPFFGISPDCTQVAYMETQDNQKTIAVASLKDEQSVKTFHLPDKKLTLVQIAWMPDGKSLLYLTAERDFGNYVLWKQTFNENAPNQIVNLGNKEIRGFNLPISPDGKTFAIPQGEWQHDAVLLKGLK